MTVFTTHGLVAGGRVGPQVLGHQGPRLVVSYSGEIDIAPDPANHVKVCPLDQVFVEPQNPVLVFGTPNVSVIFPDESGRNWQRFAAFMFWREDSYIHSTKGRVQAGVFYELLDVPEAGRQALQEALQDLVGTRKASCAHSVALALHNAGFTAGDLSLRWVYRPTRLASILWRNGLEYDGKPIRIRVIQTDQSVPDHFVASWKKETTAPGRLYRKLLAATRQPHASAPVFDPVEESIQMASGLWDDVSSTVDVGVSIPSRLGVNLGFVLGEQPEFTANLPWDPREDLRLSTPLKAFPGKLDRVTKLKKYLLFSRPVIWLMRKHLVAHTEWIDDVPVQAVAHMLRLSPGPERDAAFVYNFAMTPRVIKLKRLLNDNGRDQKFIAWLLAKHVLLSGYDPNLLLAGEIWAYLDEHDELVICLSIDSGTYKPKRKRGEAAVELLSAMFQTKIVLVARNQEEVD